uniref:Uncharacterized protein n=1 Tax=Lactuca sativa TaxID=4236 RepID=A0A9R1VY07_LACSA|nr:hypothetical protein LSAT_V11C400212540 [Lactuca sativa]
MSCRNREALEMLHVEHMMNVKYYLDIENERVDKRINKLEDDLEKLKKDNSCLLAVEFAANTVAKVTVRLYGYEGSLSFVSRVFGCNVIFTKAF